MKSHQGGSRGWVRKQGAGPPPPPLPLSASSLKAAGGVSQNFTQPADMMAVGELVLVLGLLVSAHCEVRARDPEVEEEELGGGGLPLYPREKQTPRLGEPGRPLVGSG